MNPLGLPMMAKCLQPISERDDEIRDIFHRTCAKHVASCLALT